MITIAAPLLGLEEEIAVQRVLASGRLAQGENVALFEQRFAERCRVKEAVAVSSGTAALHLALLAHNIGPGDEVITTAFSFAATANAIVLTGATPIFVDIDPETYALDPDQVEAAITPQTKALLPVHLYGHPCDVIHMEQLAQAHSLVLIEDACQAHASSVHGRPAGSFGTGCFSFYATKNMTTGEGGMITTNDHEIAERVRLLRNHGQETRYYQTRLGYNMRMTEIQGAIGLIQLEKLEHFTARRITNANYLTEHLHNYVQTPLARSGYRHVYHQYTIRVPEHRDAWVERLHAEGVTTAIHYPIPIHRQPFYCQNNSLFRVFNSNKRAHAPGNHPDAVLTATELAARQVLSLPVHPALNEEDLAVIVRKVIDLCV